MSWKTTTQGLLYIAQFIIFVYLVYLILDHIEATEFMWFYFVFYLVLGIIIGITVLVIKNSEMKDEIKKEVSKRMRF